MCRSSLLSSNSIHRAFRPSSARGPLSVAGTVCFDSRMGNRPSDPDRAVPERRVVHACCCCCSAEQCMSARLTCLFYSATTRFPRGYQMTFLWSRVLRSPSLSPLSAAQNQIGSRCTNQEIRPGMSSPNLGQEKPRTHQGGIPCGLCARGRDRSLVLPPDRLGGLGGGPHYLSPCSRGTPYLPTLG